MTALIIALVIGAIAGWLAGLLVQGTGFGLLGDIVVGIVGAMITSLLFPKLGIGLTSSSQHQLEAALDALLQQYEGDFDLRHPFFLARYMDNDVQKDARSSVES